MEITLERPAEAGQELTDEDLEVIVGGKDRWFGPRSEPGSSMVCSGNRGMSTHTELSLEL